MSSAYVIGAEANSRESGPADSDRRREEGRVLITFDVSTIPSLVWTNWPQRAIIMPVSCLWASVPAADDVGGLTMGDRALIASEADADGPDRCNSCVGPISRWRLQKRAALQDRGVIGHKRERNVPKPYSGGAWAPRF